MRVPYSQVFTVQNGMIMPKVPVRINGVQMGPGVAFGSGVSFGGADLAAIAGHDLEVDQDASGVAEIKGHY